jgi:hypothetical protein
MAQTEVGFAAVLCGQGAQEQAEAMRQALEKHSIPSRSHACASSGPELEELADRYNKSVEPTVLVVLGDSGLAASAARLCPERPVVGCNLRSSASLWSSPVALTSNPEEAANFAALALAPSCPSVAAALEEYGTSLGQTSDGWTRQISADSTNIERVSGQ